MRKEEILQRFRAYERAASAVRHEMLVAGVRQRLAAGTTVFHGGDTVQQFAVVGEGRIRVFKSGGTGREITLYNVGTGEVCLLTVASILGRRGYPAMAVVEETLEAAVYPADRLRHWVDVSPAVREMVFSLFTSRLAHVMALIEEIVFRRLDARLGEFLDARFGQMAAHIDAIGTRRLLPAHVLSRRAARRWRVQCAGRPTRLPSVESETTPKAERELQVVLRL